MSVPYNKQYQEYLNEIKKMNKEIIKELEKKDPYVFYMQKLRDAHKKEKEELTIDIGDYEDVYKKRLAIDKWYEEERKKLQEKQKSSPNEDFALAETSLNNLYNERSKNADNEVWQERGEKIADIFGNGLEDILTSYGDFDTSMRKITKDLYDYLITESAKALLQQVFNAKQMQSIMNALTLGGQKGGVIGAASNLIKGIGKGFGIFHSGGVVPVGANPSLPGTKEQLALLKGGERILSPAENTNYSSDTGTSPVVFNHFNIKAWDSKDVQSYLLENKELLNSITFDGIKNNSSQLRFMVRNA